MSAPNYKDVLRQTVEAVYRAALLEFERLQRLGSDFTGSQKGMTAFEAKLHLRLVRYLQAHAMREEGKTLSEIGLLFGVSRQRVNQLLKPPSEYKKPGRPKRRLTPALPPGQPKPLPDVAYRYRLQVRDKFTYLNDVWEIEFLVNSLLHRSLAGSSHPFDRPVALSEISITLSALAPGQVERVWYSSGLELLDVNPPHHDSSGAFSG